MIEATPATLIVMAFILVFGIGVPILNVKFPKFISYRWSVVVVAAALVIGATVDFKELPHDARKIILMGGFIILGAYVALRSIEKVLANGWLQGARIEAHKGDMGVTISSDDDPRESDANSK